jgi:alkanesulfonate monooxygenase SsuD/methylene tetrahydromethanopterin reductase-like flavin-dependent oxidoreductase (luciferase family)
VIFGMGRGLSRTEYAPFGIAMSQSRGRFDEAATMIAMALETGWIEGDGPYYPRPRTRLRPSPPRSCRGRLYRVAGSSDSVSSCVALGASLLTIVTQPVPNLMPVFTTYREQYRAAHGVEAPPIGLNPWWNGATRRSPPRSGGPPGNPARPRADALARSSPCSSSDQPCDRAVTW